MLLILPTRYAPIKPITKPTARFGRMYRVYGRFVVYATPTPDPGFAGKLANKEPSNKGLS